MFGHFGLHLLLSMAIRLLVGGFGEVVVEGDGVGAHQCMMLFHNWNCLNKYYDKRLDEQSGLNNG